PSTGPSCARGSLAVIRGGLRIITNLWPNSGTHRECRRSDRRRKPWRRSRQSRPPSALPRKRGAAGNVGDRIDPLLTRCQAYLSDGEEGVLLQEINLEEATGVLAARYAPERYREAEE